MFSHPVRSLQVHDEMEHLAAMEQPSFNGFFVVLAGHSLPGVSGQSFDVKCLSQMIYDQNPSPIYVKKLEDTLYPSTIFSKLFPFLQRIFFFKLFASQMFLGYLSGVSAMDSKIWALKHQTQDISSFARSLMISKAPVLKASLHDFRSFRLHSLIPAFVSCLRIWFFFWPPRNCVKHTLLLIQGIALHIEKGGPKTETIILPNEGRSVTSLA